MLLAVCLGGCGGYTMFDPESTGGLSYSGASAAAQNPRPATGSTDRRDATTLNALFASAAQPRLDVKIFDANAFAVIPEEIRLRLLLRAINRFGHEGPAELGKVEALLAALDRTVSEQRAGCKPGLNKPRLKQTLAGALISLIDGRIRVEPAPPRRHRAR